MCWCSSVHGMSKRRERLEAKVVLRSMSVSGAASMLYRSTFYPKSPVILRNACNSSTVVGGVTPAIAASLDSVGRTPYHSHKF